LEQPVYGPRKLRDRLIDPFVPYLRERVTAYPGLTGRRLWREVRERGYQGGYTIVTDVLRDLRPAPLPAFEVRFETPPGDQAQVDFAQFQVVFTDEPTVTRIVWLFSLVLGFSRLIWARFVLHQDMQAVLRCHMAAFEAIGGVPHEILYDRMKTAVIGEVAGSIVYNRALIVAIVLVDIGVGRKEAPARQRPPVRRQFHSLVNGARHIESEVLQAGARTASGRSNGGQQQLSTSRAQPPRRPQQYAWFFRPFSVPSVAPLVGSLAELGFCVPDWLPRHLVLAILLAEKRLAALFDKRQRAR